jgi:hypothetical protein
MILDCFKAGITGLSLTWGMGVYPHFSVVLLCVGRCPVQRVNPPPMESYLMSTEFAHSELLSKFQQARGLQTFYFTTNLVIHGESGQFSRMKSQESFNL